MELNDNEFDAAFRKKVFHAEPQFEESAWNKMEQKLKRRARLVFFRKSAIVCFMLLAALGGYFAFQNNPLPQTNNVVKKINRVTDSIIGKNDSTNVVPHIAAAKKTTAINTPLKVNEAKRIEHLLSLPALDHVEIFNEQLAALPDQIIIPETLKGISLPGIQAKPSGTDLPESKTAISHKRNLPLSFAISAGPEFNSASSIVGGKTGFNAGITLGFGITGKLDLQTGVRYSVKDYQTDNFGYRFAKPNVQNLVANIDASCAVLEIPLQASYTVAENHQRSINLNAGISSYLMLKEDYTFNYIPQSGINDRFLQKRNENQHFLSVVDLSATYFIKLRKDNLKLGFEPFVKIPLTGVGEGKVNLKSSGVSLKLRYDLDKKNN